MKKILLVSIILLLVALFQLPYGYYQFLRLFICGIAIFFAYKEYSIGRNINWIFITFTSIAIIYNPIFRIYLEREIWQWVNVFTAVALAIYLFLQKNKT